MRKFRENACFVFKKHFTDIGILHISTLKINSFCSEPVKKIKVK